MPEPFTGKALAGCMYCLGIAELEEEDGLRKWVCPDCGGEFGFARISQPEETCSLGIPENIRADMWFRQHSETQQQPGPLVVISGADIPVRRSE